MGDDTDDFLAWLDSLAKEPNDTVKAAFAAYKATVKPAPDLAELVEALRWYGEQSRLARLIHSEGDAGRHAIAADGGKRAAAALAKIKEPQHG